MLNQCVGFCEAKRIKMAKGFINITVSSNGDVDYYGREKECLYILSSVNLSKDKSELIKDWKHIESQEKMGDKTLGIRGRHDAQVRKNYVLSLPNELSPEVGAKRVEKILEQTPIKDCSYSIFIHRGEKDGIVNQHAHVIVNERNLKTMKKDRTMIKHDFLEKSFRPLYSKEFEAERQQGLDYERRERLGSELFYVDTAYSRQELKGEVEQSRQSVAPQNVAQPNQDYSDLLSLMESYDKISKEKEMADLLAAYEKIANQKEEEKQKQESLKEQIPTPKQSKERNPFDFGMGM